VLLHHAMVNKNMLKHFNFFNSFWLVYLAKQTH